MRSVEDEFAALGPLELGDVGVGERGDGIPQRHGVVALGRLGHHRAEEAARRLGAGPMVMIGVPTSPPVRASAWSVSRADPASWDSSSTWSA